MEQFAYQVIPPSQLTPFSGYLLPHVERTAASGDGAVTVCGVITGGYACGAAALELSPEDGGKLLSFFVDPQVRGLGVGSSLLRFAAEQARSAGIRTLSLSYVLGGDELKAFDRMVRSMGTEPRFYAPVYSIFIAQLHDSRLVGRAFKPNYRIPENVIQFSALTRQQTEELYANPEVPRYVHPRERDQMQPELSLAYLQEGRVTGFWLGNMSSPGNYAVQGVWRSSAAPLTTFHTLVAAHLNLCYYHGGGDYLYHCSPVGDFADELIQRYSEGKYRLLEEHQATIHLEPFEQGATS